jgi:hypothetical protein
MQRSHPQQEIHLTSHQLLLPVLLLIIIFQPAQQLLWYGLQCRLWSNLTQTGTLSIPQGTTAVDIIINPIDDEVAEGTETVILALAT